MTSRHMNPAIYAGITGAAVFAVPNTAHAAVMFGQNVPFTETSVAFVAGCVSGALVAGGVYVAAERIAQFHLERTKAADIVIPQARHAAPVARSTAVTASESFGRHSAAAHAVDAWEQTGTIRVQAAHFGSHYAAEPEPVASGDYVDIAESYVEKMTLAQRMTTRAKGVANVLSERLGASKMEDLPIIKRADGTVGDLGESWWDSAFAERISGPESLSTNTQPELKSQVELYPDVQTFAEPQVSASAQISESVPAVFDSVEISQDAMAEKQPRWTDKQQDLWAVALNALDERFEEQIAFGTNAIDESFVDEIGNSETIDEPEGLEPATEFMVFKPQAGHSEVVDTSSYIDLLIDQEFSRNKSAAARKSVRGVLRNYLTVVDGGTGDLKSKKTSAPAHMMPVAQIAY